MKDEVKLDLGKTKVGRLFVEYYFPTLLSLSFSALLNVIDGIFVGRGVGSDALAAVNVAAPVFMIATGIGLMLG
ncbi:MAG: MATE family efflux transporter, partial [Bacteroidales bacterium]|nr:MATE family efflux transporter [Bacteroidales bacterium]